GGNVILDLGFMKVINRNQFIGLAEKQGVHVQMHYVNAPYSLRLKRVIARNTEKGETFSFEVTPTMFDYMEKEFEPPTDAELKIATLINTN
ncbi:MAG: AAA family ATPase, partial [Sulfuriferula sp.]